MTYRYDLQMACRNDLPIRLADMTCRYDLQMACRNDLSIWLEDMTCKWLSNNFLMTCK